MSREAAQAARYPGTGRGPGREAFAAVAPTSLLVILIAENGDPRGGVVSFRSTRG